MYNKTVWQTGDIIPADKMNNIENGIETNDLAITDIKKELVKTVKTSEKGQPDGIAPLNPDGVLEIKYGGTGAKDSPNALYNLGAKSNDNLYDNWDFTNPINQQGKEIYTGVGYTISRYQCNQSFGSVEIIKGTGVKFKSDGEVTVFSQPCTKEFAENLVGKTFTLSVLLSDGRLFSATNTIEMKAPAININLTNDPTIHTNFQVAFFPEHNLYQIFRAEVYQAEITVKAVKLELGSTQTLARQRKDCSHELLEKPDYVTELLKCQQYYQLYSSPEKRPTKAIDCRPVMRIDPSQTTIQIDGVTYYVNDANL